MNEIFGLFLFIGLAVSIFVVIFGITCLAGRAAGDDHDCTMRWIFTCLAYAITTAIFILVLNSKGRVG